MAEKQNTHEQVWERGWEEHERLQRLRMADLPFHEKLRWLEEAQMLVDHMAKSRAKKPPDEGR